MNKFEKQLEKWNKGTLRGAQAKLAKILKVSTATVALWATGKRHPSKGYVAQMAELFQLDTYGVLKLFEKSAAVVYSEPSNKHTSHALREKTKDSDRYTASSTQNIPSNSVQLPVLSVLPLQFPLYPEDNVLEWWSLPRRYAQGARYLIRSKDIALKDAFSEDDLCFIKPGPDVTAGAMLLWTDGQGAYLISKYPQKPKKMGNLCRNKSNSSVDKYTIIGQITKRIKPF